MARETLGELLPSMVADSPRACWLA